jgi:hypothetical protein
MMAVKETISHIEAINIVGKALFAEDWIGEIRLRGNEMIFPSMPADERALIEDLGPRPAVRGGITIKPCPPSLQAKLERALGRRERIPAQRGAAADWLLDCGLLDFDCDRDAIVTALSGRPTSASPKKKVGRRRKFESIALLMVADVAALRRTEAWLRNSGGKNLKAIYGADEKTCRKARKLALSSFS